MGEVTGTIVGDQEIRTHDGLRVIKREFGRILVELVCPFCSSTVFAYLWSLAGSGKRCACGAVCGQISASKKLARSA